MTDAVENEGRDGYPELLADLADQIAMKLVESGVEVDRAADIGFAAAEHVRRHWAGQSLYLPKGMRYDFDRKYLEIFEAFNGRNHAELAGKHNLTVMRIYQIIKAVRAEMIRRNQGSLF